jgi:hypothetical protein
LDYQKPQGEEEDEEFDEPKREVAHGYTTHFFYFISHQI